MRVTIVTSTLLLVAGSAFSSPCDDLAQQPERVRQERITGNLLEAANVARTMLACPSVPNSIALQLSIELARALRRVSLHQKTSATEALQVLTAAKAFVTPDDRAAQAHLDLALSDYYYGAEVSEAKFPLSSEYAQRAHQIFTELDDAVGLTDSTHRLGMIAFQRRELEKARILIQESLEISKRAPDRPIFLSDFHRHFGFVMYLSENLESAISHFEKSLDYRVQARSQDYSLFAYNMLAAALIEAGRPQEAKDHLEAALRIAKELPSPVGQLRVTFNQGEMYEALREPEAAVSAFREALRLAEHLSDASYSKPAAEAIERLTRPSR